MSRNFTVRVFLINSNTVSDKILKVYIHDAVEAWHGCFPTEHELFNNIERVIVTKKRKSKKTRVY